MEVCNGRNHLICRVCWDRRNPQRPYKGQSPMIGVEVGPPCCFCGGQLHTADRIYVRHTPGMYEPEQCPWSPALRWTWALLAICFAPSGTREGMEAPPPDGGHWIWFTLYGPHAGFSCGRCRLRLSPALGEFLDRGGK